MAAAWLFRTFSESRFSTPRAEIVIGMADSATGVGWAHALKPKGRSHRHTKQQTTPVRVEVSAQFERYYNGVVPASDFTAFMVFDRLESANLAV